jgi:hypothetical protein
MSIIFQLFSAEDLKSLDPTKLEALREVVRAHFNSRLDTTLNTKLNDSSRITPQVIAGIWERARNVYQQLKNAPLSPTPPSSLNLSQPLFPQFFPLAGSNLTPYEREILEMAISCEITNFNYYDHLQTLKEFVYDKFDDLTATPGQSGTGQRPRGPDTFYSPFNPESPLNFIYHSEQWPPP